MRTHYLRAAISGIALICAACEGEPAGVPVAPSAVAPPPTCREFEHTITVDGIPEPANGSLCQRADGTWYVVSSQSVDLLPAPPPDAAPVTAYPLFGLGFGFGHGHGRGSR